MAIPSRSSSDSRSFLYNEISISSAVFVWNSFDYERLHPKKSADSFLQVQSLISPASASGNLPSASHCPPTDSWCVPLSPQSRTNKNNMFATGYDHLLILLLRSCIHIFAQSFSSFVQVSIGFFQVVYPGSEVSQPSPVFLKFSKVDCVLASYSG